MKLHERENLLARQGTIKSKIDFLVASLEHVSSKKHIKMVQDKIDELLDEFIENERRLENE